MALWTCECGTLFAVGLLRCPHCGELAENFRKAADMPKTSVGAGGSNALGQPPDEPEAAPAETPAVVPEIVTHGTAETDTEPQGGDEDDGPPDYGAYRIVDLRDLCRERGLSPTGAKSDLADRLAGYDEEHRDQDAYDDAHDELLP